jgi:hypothetical protein
MLAHRIKHKLVPVLKLPKRRSRFNGMHSFKNGALASAKGSFSVSQS